MSRKLCLFLLVCCLHIPSSLGIFSDIVKAFIDDHPPKGKEQPEVCPKGDVSCRDGLKCIHKTWLCDGHRDCNDGSDEDSCKKICNAQQFQCDQNRCVPLVWRCDGMKDCLDESDEDPQVCDRSTCPPDHYRCKSGECIPKHWKCDGSKDCKGGDDEDENMCAKAKECYAGERACKNNKCISNSLWCDGRADCTDGSDEASCSNEYQNDAPVSCNKGQFRCGNGRCIPERWVCDGWKDCEDSSDEKTSECLPSSTTSSPFFETFSPRSSGENREMTGGLASHCTSGDFTCKDGECIPLNWRCDLNKDCEDGSDEFGCEKPADKFLLVTHANSTLRQSECFHDQFACVSPAKSKICLPLAQVCDKKMDCLNGTDEGVGCEGACKNDNGQCSHKCNPTPISAVCSCPTGYFLSGDMRTCLDVDECQGSSGPCDQKCNNTVGSYECSCAPGFTLEKDRHSCKSNTDAILLFACDQQIRLASLSGEHEAQIFKGKDRLVLGLDYVQENSSTTIFYSDEERRRLSMVKLVQPQNQERVILDNIQGVAEVAYDWVAKNLYFVDRVRGQIGICALGRSFAYCTQLLPSQAQAIAVHPGHSMLFLAEGGSNGGKIVRTFLDGSGKTTVVDKKLLSPQLLTIDFIHDRLYFADAKVNFLESCKLDGTDRRTVFHMKNAQPYGLSIFNGQLYYTDWSAQAIKKVAANGSHAVTLFNTPRKPMSIAIMHESRQPKFASVCQADKNPCQHICAAKAAGRHSCMCHEGFKLNANGITCDPVAGMVSLFRKDGVEAPRPINFTNGAHHGKRQCNRKDRPTVDEVCICMLGNCFWEPIAEDVKATNARTGSGEEFGNVHAEPSVHKTSLRASDLSSYSAATLAGIICACLVSIMALLLIVFLLRKYKPHLMDPYSDEKSLIDDVDSSPRAKQIKPRCPGNVGASFNNPTYENVTPGSSAYMVKFYKSGYNRISAEGRAAPPTPSSSAQTV